MAAHLLTAHESSSLVAHAEADPGSVASSASTTTSSAPMAVITMEHDGAPSRLTAEEAELLWGNEYHVRRKTEQKNDHNWKNKIEAIFATAAGASDLTSHRTIWPRSRD